MALMFQLSVGDVVVDLFGDDAAKSVCANLVRLCEAKYYHGCLFYNVQPNCLAQAGDPTASGRGGCAFGAHVAGAGDAAAPRDRFVAWGLSRDNRGRRTTAGLLCVAAMGNAGGASGEDKFYGSQFFFTLRGDDLEHLDAGGHKLGALYLDGNGRPWEDVRVLHTHVLEDPFEETFPPPPDYRPPPSPTREIPEREVLTARVAYGAASREPEDGLTPGERAARDAEKKAKSQAEVLEMIGDLPHADVEVPKTELFIAKLNKVTEDADLEIIFSRFGKIESCDIVRDWKTGDSLNFAFIAFEEEKACVEAYKKMNNVLIDDSRIRDFSQSVAKIWSRYTMQYKGGAAKKLRDRHKAANAPARTRPLRARRLWRSQVADYRRELDARRAPRRAAAGPARRPELRAALPRRPGPRPRRAPRRPPLDRARRPTYDRPPVPAGAATGRR
ncbi:peptidyl-prolyl cis-trans isomerase [Aureococcus anophagefferens]|nr:peptidyl-prolyl cis-trans isomerase [Aureococcus anophagefferens]